MSKAKSRLFYFDVDEDEIPSAAINGDLHPRAKFRLPPQGLYDFAQDVASTMATEADAAKPRGDDGKVASPADFSAAGIIGAAVTDFRGNFEYALDSVYLDKETWPKASPNDEEVLRERINFLTTNLAMPDQLQLMAHIFSQLRVTEKERGESSAPAE